MGHLFSTQQPRPYGCPLVAMEKLGIQNPQAYFDTLSKNNLIWKMKKQVLTSIDGKYGYFAGKTKIFNYGTDEYANDATNAPGWYYLRNTTNLYSKFAEYVILQLLWQKREVCNQWPSTAMASTTKTDDIEFDKSLNLLV